MKLTVLFIVIFSAYTSLYSTQKLSDVWMNLKNGNLEFAPSGELKYFGTDILVSKNGENIEQFIKIKAKNKLSAEVFFFEDNKTVHVANAIVTLFLQDDYSFILNTISDKFGRFFFDGLREGNYKLKIVKDEKYFIGDVYISQGTINKRCYLRSDKESNYNISVETTAVLLGRGLKHVLNFTLTNNGKRSERVCLDFVFDKNLIKKFTISKPCMMLERRKSVSIPLEIEFKQINSNFNRLHLEIIVDNKINTWRDFISIPLFFKTQKAKFSANSDDVKAYILTPENNILKLNNEDATIEFLVTPSKEYKIIIFGKTKNPKYAVDIWYEQNSNKYTSIKQPLLLKRSIYNNDIGKILEYSFKTMDSIVLNEDSKEVSFALLAKNINRFTVLNDDLIRVRLENSKIYIKPYRDMYGSTFINLFSKDMFKKRLHVIIKNINDVPVIVFEPKYLLNLGEHYSYIFKAFDADNDFIEKTVVHKPKWLQYDEVSGELSGVVQMDENNSIVLKVQDQESEVFKKRRFIINTQESF